jgi:protein-tyrosine-phosphatase
VTAQKSVVLFFPRQYDAIHWNIEDPASAEGTESERMTDFRRVRHDIFKKINNSISNIL